ncbi:MAG: transposase [Myxococcales bacterium]|nr:transposase [Myxococcales bacterium]
MQLVVQVLLGFRRLRDRDYFADDPMVCRILILGVSRLLDVATISRALAAAGPEPVEGLRGVLGGLVLERLAKLRRATVTLDFDGSVQSTRRHAEGSAVGYNKKRKGARSYYPLFCTVSQTWQFLDMHHRPGNVHDSRGAEVFIEAKIADVRSVLPHARLESRLDSAFFSETLLATLERLSVEEFSISVPFERFRVCALASCDAPVAGSASTTTAPSSSSTGDRSRGPSRIPAASSPFAHAGPCDARGRCSSTSSSPAITSTSTRSS